MNKVMKFKKILTIIYKCGKVFMLLVGSFFYAKNPSVQLLIVKQEVRMEVWKMRVKVTMACSECKQRNYNSMKNKKNDPDRLDMNKYCRFCKKHTQHKETKQY